MLFCALENVMDPAITGDLYLDMGGMGGTVRYQDRRAVDRYRYRPVFSVGYEGLARQRVRRRVARI